MANQLHVELVAVEEKVWSGEAEMVIAPAIKTEGKIYSPTRSPATITSRPSSPATKTVS